MAKIRLKFNRDAFEALRKEPGVRDYLEELGREVASEATRAGSQDLPVIDSDSTENSGYKVTDLLLEDPRGAVSVMAVGAAHNENRKHSTLLRGLSKTARSS